MTTFCDTKTNTNKLIYSLFFRYIFHQYTPTTLLKLLMNKIVTRTTYLILKRIHIIKSLFKVFSYITSIPSHFLHPLQPRHSNTFEKKRKKVTKNIYLIPKRTAAAEPDYLCKLLRVGGLEGRARESKGEEGRGR